MTPSFSISVGGDDVTGNFNDRLLELTLTDNAGKEVDEITFRLDDRDFAIELPPRGTMISVALGYKETGLVDKGLFEVSDTSGRGFPYEVTIHAKSASQRDDQKSQRTTNRQNKSVKDIANDVASDHGLTPAIGDGFDDLQFDVFNQDGESDWHMLSRFARTYDATFAVKNGNLIFTQASDGTSASGQDLPTVEIDDMGQLLGYEFAAGDRPKHKTVEASWYDRTTGKKQRESVDISDSDSSDEGSSAEATYRIRHLHHDQTHAQHAAKAKAAQLQRAEMSCSVEIIGDPTVSAEGNMVINVGRPGLDGEWIVKTVVHSFDADKIYTTKITGEAKTDSGDISSDSSGS